MKKIKVFKLTEKYLLNNSKEMIYAKIHCDTGRVTLTTKSKGKTFMFHLSDPARIARIGQLLINSSKLYEKK